MYLSLSGIFEREDLFQIFENSIGFIQAQIFKLHPIRVDTRDLKVDLFHFKLEYILRLHSIESIYDKLRNFISRLDSISGLNHGTVFLGHRN